MKSNKKVKETASTGAASAGAIAVGAGSLFGGTQKKKPKKSNEQAIRPSVIKRIAENLVRVEDIVNDRQVYGLVTESEKTTIKSMVSQSSINGLAYEDAVIAVTEYFKHANHDIVEVTTGTTGTMGTNAAATSNVTVSTNNMQNKPVDQRGIEAISQMVKNAGLNPSQLNQVMNKARMK
jgi:hypothetical protein